MAFPLLHLLVADAYAKGRPALERDGAYYLGAIAPDAIHMRPGITKEVHKVKTHLFAKGSDGLPEVMAYWYETGRTPFDIGYGVHVITDRLWVGYYRKVFPRLIGANGQTLAEIYQPDAAWIDRALYAGGAKARAFGPLLQSAPVPDAHPLLSGEEIDGWRRQVLALFDAVREFPRGDPAVMTLSGVQAFIPEAAARLEVLIPG